MSHVVCLMNVESDRATFTWSEGPASFEPYTLDGMVYKDFKEIADKAREKLADLVKDSLDHKQGMPKSEFALAEAGHELYQAVFDPGAGQAREAKQVRKWLEQLAQQHEVDTLEIVVESPWSLPWNIIYDREPDKEAFLAGDESPDRWKPFWGLRYNLAGGRKVDPLRRMPLLDDPKVLMVVDPEIRDGLPEEQQKRLAEFAESHQFSVVHSKDALQDAVKAERPDLLYWLSHASADALMLADEPISPRNMRKLLRQDDDEHFGGLAFLNACQTAEAGEGGSFFEAFHNVGFAGMIGTEHQTVDQFANPLGLDFLEAFLDRGEAVGAALRKLRGRVPLGLLYGTYCPPDIRVDRGDVHDSVRIQPVHVEGVPLRVGLAADETATRTLPPLPAEPYRSLAYYDREDRALFAGRDPDVERFATYLDDASTRILVLHGESGVGKSSFLHAGVIPYLEEECLGYRFLRDREAAASAGPEGSVIFVRATNDLFGQLAHALCEFCARPYEYRTPLGDPVAADLPGVLRELIGEDVSQRTVRVALRSDPSLLGQIMSAISNCLPFSAILVIDQGEEIFTLAQTPEDRQRGKQALDMLRRTVGAAGDFKVIVCLRTEYYGRVIDRLRRGLHDTGSIREYLLTDFDEDDLLDAVRRPTLDVQIPYASEVPSEKYGFRYADGVPEEIARRLIRYTTQRRDSVLPLMQVVCAQLYHLAQQRADKTITLTDLETLGGIEGGMRNHVDGLLSHLLKGRPLDKKPVQKLFTQLYLKQPDGSLTTALLGEDEVQKRWTGRLPFGTLLQSCVKLRLLKVNTLRIGREEERRYVSLGHDALAKIAADWKEQLSRGARVRKMAVAIGVVSTIAICMAVMAIFAWNAKVEAQRQTANAYWKVAAVARDRHLDVKAAHNFLLAAQAADRAGDEPLRHSIELAAQFATSSLVRAFPPDSRVKGVQVSGNESRVLTWNDDGSVKVWDVTNDEAHQYWNLPAVTGAVFSQDGSRVVAWSEGGAVKLWDVTSVEALQHWKHAKAVNGAAFSSNGSRVLTWSEDGGVKLRDVTNAKLSQEWKHAKAVNGAAFSSNGSRVLTWSEDGGVKLRDVTNAKLSQDWKHDKAVNSAIFSRDGSLVLTWNYDGEVELWDVTCDNRLWKWKHEEAVNGAVFSRDGSRVLAWSGSLFSGEVKLWDVMSDVPLQTWTHGETGVSGAVFSHDEPESQVLSWSYDNALKLWDVKQAEPLQDWKHDQAVNGAIFSRDGSRVLSWGYDGAVKWWDVTSDTPLRNWKHDGSVTGAEFTGDEAEPRVLAWSADGAVKMWDVTKDEPLHEWKHDQAVAGAVLTRDESRVFAWSANGAVNVWDVTPAEPLQVWKHDGAVFTRNGSRVLAWSDDGAVKLWDVKNAKLLPDWKHDQAVTGAVCTRDGSRVLAWSDDGAVKLWDVKNAKLLQDWKYDHPFTGAAFTRDGGRILAWRDDGAVKLWDVKNAKLLHDWKCDHPITGAVFTRDGSRVLAWSEVGAVMLWDVKNAKILQDWKHDHPFTGAAFTRDGSRALSWSDDGAVQLWDVREAKPQVWKHDGLVTGAVFTRDGSRALSWGEDGAVKLWDVTRGKMLQDWKHDRRVVGAVFSRDEPESRVLSWDLDGTEQLWDVKLSEAIRVWKNDGQVTGAVFADEVSRVLAWSQGGAVKLWDVTQDEPILEWKHDRGITGAVFTGDESRVLAWTEDDQIKLWDCAVRDARLTLTERILELEVRAAKKRDLAGRVVPLTFEDWKTRVDSPAYKAIQKKKNQLKRELAGVARPK